MRGGRGGGFCLRRICKAAVMVNLLSQGRRGRGVAELERCSDEGVAQVCFWTISHNIPFPAVVHSP